MSETFVLRDLYSRLREDISRQVNRFSDDLALAHEILFHGHATKGEQKRALSLWMQKNQPCLFGRIAAASDYLHFCILTEKDGDFFRSDQQISKLIQDERLAWKRRSLCPKKEFSRPAHGFILVASSHRLATAALDDTLFQFACKLRELWGCEASEQDPERVHLETLFLQNPRDETYLKFTFSVDFFAAQADGRWWQDHRSPGGLLFTANSVGHMRRYREWYQSKDDQIEWILQTAMGTIALAADTPHGKATWLRPLSEGKPFVSDVACPFKDPTRLKPELKNMDWTRYGGHLHTDHNVRKEFFSDSPKKSLDLVAEEWLEDFTYLFSPKTIDHLRFVAGEALSYDAVTALLGKPEDFPSIVGPGRMRGEEPTAAKPAHPDVQRLLHECQTRWGISPQDLWRLAE